EIESVIRAFLYRDEFLQSVRRAKHGVHALKALDGRNAWIVRVASHPDFVFVSYRNHAVEEVRDALPVDIGSHAACPSLRRKFAGILSLLQAPFAVGGSTAARSAPNA